MSAAICNESKIHECKLHPSLDKKKRPLKQMFIIKP